MSGITNVSAKLLQRSTQLCILSKVNLSTQPPPSVPQWKKWAKMAGLVAGGTLVLTGATVTTALASDLALPLPSLPWGHNSALTSLDHGSIRRGYQVYREVCAACHSLKFIAYRHLIDVCLTQDEAKAISSEILVKDGPNEEGEMFERPGRIGDYHPDPYKNEEAARLANNGAYPPDLSYIILARNGQEDYVFHLLTGYYDAPPGSNLQEGQHYNPYFAGSRIGMARALYDDMIEYEDGTPATTSQMAKDITTFLRWSADPHMDDRKRMLPKVGAVLSILLVTSYYYYRRTWSTLKTAKIVYKNRPKPKSL